MTTHKHFQANVHNNFSALIATAQRNGYKPMGQWRIAGVFEGIVRRRLFFQGGNVREECAMEQMSRSLFRFTFSGGGNLIFHGEVWSRECLGDIVRDGYLDPYM